MRRIDAIDLGTAAASITRALAETVPGSVVDACCLRAYEALTRIAKARGLNTADARDWPQNPQTTKGG
jgi:hypothetical protein